VEGDAGEILHALRERPLHVLGEEERGIAQAGDDDPLHPAHDLRLRGAVAVGEGREACDQGAFAERDVLLVMDENGLQHLRRQFPELFRDATEHDGRPLDEVLPLRQQVEVGNVGSRHRRQLRLDDLFALGRIGDHAMLLERLSQGSP
jgi:hypothetical protein